MIVYNVNSGAKAMAWRGGCGRSRHFLHSRLTNAEMSKETDMRHHLAPPLVSIILPVFNAADTVG